MKIASKVKGQMSAQSIASWIHHNINLFRVVSSKISGEKFPEIHSNLSGNLSKNLFSLFMF